MWLTMETNTSQMINLNGSNYHLWKTRMEDLLYVNGFHQPVICSEKPDGKTNEEWDLLHRRVCGYIRQWVDDTVLNHVSEEIDARILWSKLTQLYAPKTCAGKLFLIKQLMSLRYHDGITMSNHLNIFQGIINQLSVMGIKFDDELQGLWLLGTLPDSWEAFRNSILNASPDGVISVDQAKNIILNEEMRRKSQGPVLCSYNLHGVASYLYTTIKVARDEDLHRQIGKDIFFELVDHDKVFSFCVHKQISFACFKDVVAKEFGIPVQYQRFWLWVKRQNRTFRPLRPLTLLEEAHSVSVKATNSELKLFLEVEIGKGSMPIPPPAITDKILLFFKLYDPLKEELRYVGRLFVKLTGTPEEILTKLNELAGFAPDEKIELFEEIKFEPNVMCIHVDKKLTFRASEIQHGDIICFQKPLPAGTIKCRYPEVPSFLEYVHKRQVSLA